LTETRVFFDAHIHSMYSRATSKEMNLETLSRQAAAKGLNMLGTGDFTHPLWLRELKSKLKPVEDTGLYEYGGILWMLTTEVATVYEKGGKVRKIHHLIHAPDFEVVEQINAELSKYGDLARDGRPMFSGLTSPELVEILMEISKDILVVPAHAWTSWWSVFGAFSGFNHIKECYEDQIKHIYAIETGLSSDPPMNWRVSWLDDYTLVSNSDAHSPWTWRLGRELNVFSLRKVSYWSIIEAIKQKDKSKFLFTVEVPPEYGKYHYTGHRGCGISLHPKEAMKLSNICPKCGRKLTIGVLQRVEELADRPEGYRPPDAIPFRYLLPLYEIISFATGVGTHYSKQVGDMVAMLVKKFGSELNVLLYAPYSEIKEAIGDKIANAIIAMRRGKFKIEPGYDGVYGRPVFGEQLGEQQCTLLEFGDIVE